jgi:hypothetical protein
MDNCCHEACIPMLDEAARLASPRSRSVIAGFIETHRERWTGGASSSRVRLGEEELATLREGTRAEVEAVLAWTCLAPSVMHAALHRLASDGLRSLRFLEDHEIYAACEDVELAMGTVDMNSKKEVDDGEFDELRSHACSSPAQTPAVDAP